MIWILSTLPSPTSALQSSISALERDIVALERRSSGLEPWLGWFTLVVAIGVALEIFVVIHDHRKEVNEWLLCELIPEGPSLKKLGIEILSIVLVIVGVMGEFGVGLKISSINGQLRTKSADLRSKSDQLIALLTKETEDENLARVKLEATVAWRRLSPKQQSIMSDDLKPLVGPRVGVSYLNGEAEGLGFSNDIAAAFRAAKWSVVSPREPFTQFGGFGGGVIPLESLTGVNVSDTGNRLGRDAADAIQHELCSLGFDTTITRKPQAFGPGDPKIDVELLIVGRPPTQQGLTQLTIDASTAMKSCRGSQ